MITRIRRRIALLPVLAALALALFAAAAPRAQADDGNLPVYTSPIDVTGLKLQLQVAAPDRESGKPVAVTLPTGLLPPEMSALFATPLSAQIDQQWSAIKDPETGLTRREETCDGKDGIKVQLQKEVKKIGSSYSAYDISCELASTGMLVVKQLDSSLLFGYTLTGNKVHFSATTPFTCSPDGGTFLCPNNPRFTVSFASQIVIEMRTPDLCHLAASNGLVYTQAVDITSNNFAAVVGQLIKGDDFFAAERAMEAAVKKTPLPLDAAFAKLRASDACTGKNPAVSRLLTAFRDFETEIDLRQGIIMRMSHVGIAKPALDAPNPGAAFPTMPTVPSFAPPMIATSQPLVTAGNSVQVSGQYFPPNVNFATALPVSIDHGGYGENSVILGGVCFNGATEIEWGPAGGQLRVERIPGGPQGACAPKFDATGLTPGAAYQFRARDCDPITCSPWSAPLRVTTAKADANKGTVALTLDNGTALGTTTVDAQGKFEATVTTPAGTPAGSHALHAVNGDARAQVGIDVAAAGAPRKGSITIVGQLPGETGCPNHPLSSAQVEDWFMMFGAGFAPGAVEIRIDSATGLLVGTVTANADGSFCQKMTGVPYSQVGDHTLVAVQSGAV